MILTSTTQYLLIWIIVAALAGALTSMLFYRKHTPITDLSSLGLGLVGSLIGSVKRIQLPSEAALLSEIDFKNVPESMQLRLLATGFLQIKVGILRRDGYVLTDQIKGIVHDKIYLTILRDELLIF